MEACFGVFNAVSKLVAVNYVLREDDANLLDPKCFKQLFDGLNVTSGDEVAGTQRRLQHEIWRAFPVLLVAALLRETYLRLPAYLGSVNLRWSPGFSRFRRIYI